MLGSGQSGGGGTDGCSTGVTGTGGAGPGAGTGGGGGAGTSGVLELVDVVLGSWVVVVGSTAMGKAVLVGN